MESKLNNSQVQAFLAWANRVLTRLPLCKHPDRTKKLLLFTEYLTAPLGGQAGIDHLAEERRKNQSKGESGCSQPCCPCYAYITGSDLEPGAGPSEIGAWIDANSRLAPQIATCCSMASGHHWFYFHFIGHTDESYFSSSPSEFWRSPEAPAFKNVLPIYRNMKRGLQCQLFQRADTPRAFACRDSRELPDLKCLEDHGNSNDHGHSETSYPVIVLPRGFYYPKVRKFHHGCYPIDSKETAEAYKGRFELFTTDVATKSSEFYKQIWSEVSDEVLQDQALGEQIDRIAQEIRVILGLQFEEPVRDTSCLLYSMGFFPWQHFFYFPFIVPGSKTLGGGANLEKADNHEAQKTRVRICGGFSCSFPRLLTDIEFQALDLFCRYVYAAFLADYHASLEAESEATFRASAVAGFAHQVSHVFGESVKSGFSLLRFVDCSNDASEDRDISIQQLWAFSADKWRSVHPPGVELAARIAQLKYARLVPDIVQDVLRPPSDRNIFDKNHRTTPEQLLTEVWERMVKPLMQIKSRRKSNYQCFEKTIEIDKKGEYPVNIWIPGGHLLEAILFELLWNAFRHGAWKLVPAASPCVHGSIHGGIKHSDTYVLTVTNPSDGPISFQSNCGLLYIRKFVSALQSMRDSRDIDLHFEQLQDGRCNATLTLPWITRGPGD